MLIVISPEVAKKKLPNNLVFRLLVHLLEPFLAGTELQRCVYLNSIIAVAGLGGVAGRLANACPTSSKP
jgi:hypothetical protein